MEREIGVEVKERRVRISISDGLSDGEDDGKERAMTEKWASRSGGKRTQLGPTGEVEGSMWWM